MATKDVQLKDLSGNLLMPKTKGANVYNNSNETLGTVEAGAQVNLIESISYNSSALTITEKGVALPVFNLKKLGSSDTGYSSAFAAQYVLTKDGVAVGDTINLAKDMVVQSGTLKTATAADVTAEIYAGVQEGDPYIDLVIANADGDHIYIPVKGLVDVYTAGNGLDLAGGEFSVDTTDTTIVDTAPTANSTKFVQSGGVKTALDGKVDNLASAATAGTYTKVTIQANGLVSAGDDLDASDIPALDSAKITTMGSYEKATAAAAIATTDTLDEAIGKLEYKVDGMQGAITGAASTIVDDDLTASKFLVSNAAGKVAASSIGSDAALLVWEEL